MKILLAFLMLSTLTANAQLFNQDKAIGLRLGSGNGFGTEISFQLDYQENNRFEVDLGWQNDSDFDGFKLTGIYQWMWDIENNFSWYAGAGAGIGRYEFETNTGKNITDDDETFVTIAGQIGIEYNFDEIPLQLSIDTRPELGFGSFNDDLDLDLALSARYSF